jgi:hypothetical protein
MTTYTSTLPEELFNQLNEQAKRLSIPKNKLIEKALELYLAHLKRSEYIQSYKQMSNDNNLLLIAEEGMNGYFRQIESE